jgi:hypothetical protein
MEHYGDMMMLEEKDGAEESGGNRKGMYVGEVK